MKKVPRLKKGPKKLPRFKSDLEMARFFDTHSVADYWDQMQDVDEVIVLAPALARRIRERMKKRLSPCGWRSGRSGAPGKSPVRKRFRTRRS